jgi:glucosamine--fructose-6-phosphate aminotransferase (isomerizing)
MAREIASVPDMLRLQASATTEPVRALVERLVQDPPRLVVTCARGSSAHAATFGKHLIERHLALPVCAAAPSIASIYETELRLRGQLVLAISQSGTSDDLIAFAAWARKAGALTVAITNNEHSPLAATCERLLLLSAGAEVSVAATKTFVATLCLLSRMVAAWTGDKTQKDALQALPDQLSEAVALNWNEAVEPLAQSASLATIGRGPTLAIAREAALKLKETCGIHAEAFSGAEFLHGPVTLASQGYPILMFMPRDAAFAGMQALAANLSQKGSRILLAGAAKGIEPTCIRLPAITAGSPAADAICQIQSFYCMLVSLAARRGCNVDNPPHLRKITRTT